MRKNDTSPLAYNLLAKAALALEAGFIAVEAYEALVDVFCLFRFPEHDSGVEKTRIFLRDLLQQLDPVSQIVFNRA